MANRARIGALMRDLAHDQREPDELLEIAAEARKLCAAVDEFAEEMKEKLLTKAAHNWHGWDKLDVYWLRDCEDRLQRHAAELVRHGGGDQREVDIANFAMFHWYVHERIAAGEEASP